MEQEQPSPRRPSVTDLVESSRIPNPWVTMVYLFHALRLRNDLAEVGKLEPHLPEKQVLFDNLAHLTEELTEIGAAIGLKLEFTYEFGGPEPRYDLPEIIDGVMDLIYVAVGLALRCGVDLTAIMEEVHISNMEKVHNPAAKASHDVKWVTKPPGWQKPRIQQLLMEMGWKGD